MGNLQQEVEAVKKKLFDLIIVHLKENKLDVEKARKLAQDFLAVLPIKDQHDLLIKLETLGNQYKEVEEVYVDELIKQSNQKRNETLNKVRDAIKAGDINSALNIAKSINN